MIQADPSAVSGRGPCAPARDVGFRHYSPQPEHMVQCHSVGLKERWQSTFLHRLLLSQCPHEEGSLSIAKDPRGT